MPLPRVPKLAASSTAPPLLGTTSVVDEGGSRPAPAAAAADASEVGLGERCWLWLPSGGGTWLPKQPGPLSGVIKGARLDSRDSVHCDDTTEPLQCASDPALGASAGEEARRVGEASSMGTPKRGEHPPKAVLDVVRHCVSWLALLCRGAGGADATGGTGEERGAGGGRPAASACSAPVSKLKALPPTLPTDSDGENRRRLALSAPRMSWS